MCVSVMLTRNRLVMVIGVSVKTPVKTLLKMTKRWWLSLYVGDTATWAGFQTEKRKKEKAHDRKHSLSPCCFTTMPRAVLLCRPPAT